MISARNSWLETFKRDDVSHEPLRMGVEDGIPWGVVDGPVGAINGYAWIPREGHPWSTVDDYQDERLGEVEIHGGLTYCHNGWIGFDTLHAWDVWDPAHLESHGVKPLSSRNYLRDRWSDHQAAVDPWNKLWTLDQVVAEAQSLARQIAGAR